jgi:hypothetical protein
VRWFSAIFETPRATNGSRELQSRSYQDALDFLQSVKVLIEAGEWDCFYLSMISGAEMNGGLGLLDEKIGEMIEGLDEEALIVLLVNPSPGKTAGDRSKGFFVLAGAYGLGGEAPTAEIQDIVRTVVELCEFPSPECLEGRNLTEGLIGEEEIGSLTAEEEEILRERLNGLGYIG